MSDTSVFGSVSGITDKDLADAERYIGKPLRVEQFNREATLDNIRHFAHGIGDENPLWRDEEYAASGPYGGIVAPPAFLYSVFAPGVSPGFPGLQTFFGENTWTWYEPVRRGDRLRAEAALTGMTEKKGGNVARMIVQEGETRYYRGDGVLLARNLSKALRVPRAQTGEGLQYTAREPYVYSDAEYAAIEEAVLSYARRGATRRTWASVAIGDAVGPMLKGPLDLNTIITFYSGALPYGYAPSDIQWKRRHLARNHPELIPNNRSAAWVAEKVWPGMGHYQPHVAQAVGMPGVYDNGWMRASWVSQLVTDWAGDEGTVRGMTASLRRPNLVNDTLWFRGVVRAKRVDAHGAHLVDLDITAENQLGETTTTGAATVQLVADDDPAESRPR